MRQLKHKEIQNEEIKILKEFINICQKNKLKYYIMAGTLLGAIRHKGFIPWDDDIDVCVPRNDYDILIKKIKNGQITMNNSFEFKSKELNNYFHPFLKFVNKNILTNTSQKNATDKYLWIDIFPLDGTPENKKEAKKYMNRMFALGHIYVVKNTSFLNIIKKTQNKKNVPAKLIVKFFTIFISNKYLADTLIKEAKRYNYDDSRYIANTIWPGPLKMFHEKSVFEAEIDIMFENMKVKAFSGYDTYLKENYGDYMKLPPENKRYTHSFDAYVQDNNEIIKEK